jgi:hypothetical protein
MHVVNDKIIQIQNLKLEEFENKILKTEWCFELDMVYEEDITYQEVFENEIVCSDYFSDVYDGFKGTIIFISKCSDSFSNITNVNTNDNIYTFIKNSVKEILREDTLCRSKEMEKSGLITVSYIDILDNKFKDNLNFDKEENIYTHTKLMDYTDEIVIEGVKEVEINSSEQFSYLLK